MPVFYLHIYYRDMAARDEEGLELASLEAARSEAIAGARGIMRDELRNGRLSLGSRIEIEDSSGRMLATVPFREAITVSG